MGGAEIGIVFLYHSILYLWAHTIHGILQQAEHQTEKGSLL